MPYIIFCFPYYIILYYIFYLYYTLLTLRLLITPIVLKYNTVQCSWVLDISGVDRVFFFRADTDN